MRALLALILAVLGCLPASAQAAAWGPGRLDQYRNFPSRHVELRNVSVWLPPDYDPQGDPYAVLYMHDGQNLFDPATGFGNKEWGVDEAAARLMAEGRMRRTIVVGIWNTPRRLAEYVPAKAFDRLPARYRARVEALYGTPLSDEYLKFIVEELKPFIDRNYNTALDAENTAIMGSSMGAIVSLYALAEYPEVFGAAGAVSTHWPTMKPADGDELYDDVKPVAASFLAWLEASLPEPDGRRLYLDAGAELDERNYAAYQARVEQVLERRDWHRGSDWLGRTFAGKPHNEDAWRERVHIPLAFLLPPKGEANAE